MKRDITMKNDKRIKAIILGTGNRGFAYGDYALNCPEEFEISALCDVNELRFKEAAERYLVPKDKCFNKLSDLLAAGIT